MKLDEAWIRAHLPESCAGQPIDCFSGEYLDGLTVMQAGERGGDDVAVYRARDQEDLRWWQLKQVCRFIHEKDPPPRKTWRYLRDHAEEGRWFYRERRHYDYDAIEDPRLYGFESFLRILHFAFPPDRWEEEVRDHVRLMNYWYKVPHWDYDREKLCFVEIGGSREHDGDGVEEPRPGSVLGFVEEAMEKHGKQDLKLAGELREEVHREALAIVRQTRPWVREVVDLHPVEDYFQETWDYPGRWYTVVAIPYGYGSRKALVDALVRQTLAANPAPPEGDDPFYPLIARYPGLAVDYILVKAEGRYLGYESHREALKRACETLFAPDEEGAAWEGSPNQAVGKRMPSGQLFSSDYPQGKLSYRKAFLYPPQGNRYTGMDFVRVNAALFPKGTKDLEVYEWSTDWSDYFDDGHEWWGTLCLTVYDPALRRFAVILASATD